MQKQIALPELDPAVVTLVKALARSAAAKDVASMLKRGSPDGPRAGAARTPNLTRRSATDFMRTVIYARYSSQLQNSRSIDQQVGFCQERAEREGWTVVDVYTDYAISGGAGTSETQQPPVACFRP